MSQSKADFLAQIAGAVSILAGFVLLVCLVIIWMAHYDEPVLDEKEQEALDRELAKTKQVTKLLVPLLIFTLTVTLVGVWQSRGALPGF